VHLQHYLCENTLSHVDPLLGNDCETNNETMAITRQHIRKYATILEKFLGSGPRATMEVLLEAVFSMIRSEAI
jgi:hypothetical protein